MTNIEKIKQMDELALARFMIDINHDDCTCPAKDICGDFACCEDAFANWLGRECEE